MDITQDELVDELKALAVENRLLARRLRIATARLHELEEERKAKPARCPDACSACDAGVPLIELGEPAGQVVNGAGVPIEEPAPDAA